MCTAHHKTSREKIFSSPSLMNEERNVMAHRISAHPKGKSLHKQPIPTVTRVGNMIFRQRFPAWISRR